MVSYHFHEVSVSYQYQDFKTPLVSVSYQYQDFGTCLVSVSYRYRNFSAGWYQYRIGIEKSGIEGLWGVFNTLHWVSRKDQRIILINRQDDSLIFQGGIDL